MATIDLPLAELAGAFHREGESSPSTETSPQPRALPGDMSPADELQLVGYCVQLFQRARNARRPLLDIWYHSYEVLHNHTFDASHPAWMPRPEVPEVFPILDAIIGWMTDQSPQFTSTPAAEPFSPYWAYYEQLATDLNTVMNATWQVENYDSAIEQVLWDAFTYRTGWFKCVWNPTLHNGLGNAQLTRCDPFTIYVDPTARVVDGQTEAYIIEARTMSAQDVELNFPGALAKIGEGNWFTQDHDKTPDALNESLRPMEPRANPGAIAPATAPSWGMPGQTDRLTVTDDPGITVLDCWLRTPVEAEPFPGQPDSYKRIYNSWRRVVVAGNRVLLDVPAYKIWSHGGHPYVPYSLTDTGELYSFSYVELLAPIQKDINKNLSSISNNLDLMGNPVFLEDNRAGLSRQTITSRAGQRVKINAGGRAEWLKPPEPHPQMTMQYVQFLIGEMERVSGLSAMVRGAQPTGRNAEGVIDSIQEAAFVRIRKMLRSLNRSLRVCGDKLASMIVEFYDTPRMVAMTGPSGAKSSLALHTQHFYVASEDPDGEGGVGGGRVPMRFQLLMSADSSLPTSRQARAAEADALYAMGAIDDEAVLDAHDWPNRHQTLQRNRELKAQAGTLGQAPGSRRRG